MVGRQQGCLVDGAGKSGLILSGNVITNFGAQTTKPIIRFVRFLASKPVTRNLFLTPEKGADQIVWLAEGRPNRDWQSGAYYYKRQASQPANPQALDADLARGLWERSESLLAKWLHQSDKAV